MSRFCGRQSTHAPKHRQNGAESLPRHRIRTGCIERGGQETNTMQKRAFIAKAAHGPCGKAVVAEALVHLPQLLPLPRQMHRRMHARTRTPDSLVHSQIATRSSSTHFPAVATITGSCGADRPTDDTAAAAILCAVVSSQQGTRALSTSPPHFAGYAVWLEKCTELTGSTSNPSSCSGNVAALLPTYPWTTCDWMLSTRLSLPAATLAACSSSVGTAAALSTAAAITFGAAVHAREIPTKWPRAGERTRQVVSARG